MTSWRLSAIQMTSTPNPAENLEAVERYLSHLAQQYSDTLPHLVALPECFSLFGAKEGAQFALRETLGQGVIQERCAYLAKQYGVYLLAGTLPTTSPDETRFSASSLLFSPAGAILADYQKIHLFDVEVSDSTGSYLESASTYAGQKISIASVDDLKLGLSVCYDVRFPGLMQALSQAGMNVLTVPSAFTKVTGAAHWHTLLKARAIENQCFVLAPNQTGLHANGRETYGHSLIIDPWGNVLADAGEDTGWVSTVINLTDVVKIRQKMPVLQHNRFNSELIK